MLRSQRDKAAVHRTHAMRAWRWPWPYLACHPRRLDARLFRQQAMPLQSVCPSPVTVVPAAARPPLARHAQEGCGHARATSAAAGMRHGADWGAMPPPSVSWGMATRTGPMQGLPRPPDPRSPPCSPAHAGTRECAAQVATLAKHRNSEAGRAADDPATVFHKRGRLQVHTGTAYAKTCTRAAVTHQIRSLSRQDAGQYRACTPRPPVLEGL